jgi:CRISPR/Cas system-associated endonuclease Cas3-HD
LRGSYVFSQRKKHLKQGEKISNQKKLCKNLIHLPLTMLQKDFEKDLQKKNCKNKTCGASVVQNVKKLKKQSMHI